MMGGMDDADQKHGYPSPKPRSVQYACGLLYAQACLWAMAAFATVVVWIGQAGWIPAAPRPGLLVRFIATGILLFALAAALSAVSAFLGTRLAHGMARARIAAVLLEALMASFGVLIAYYTASAGAGITAVVPVLAGLVGATLSLIAAIALLRKHARRFTTGGGQPAPTG